MLDQRINQHLQAGAEVSKWQGAGAAAGAAAAIAAATAAAARPAAAAFTLLLLVYELDDCRKQEQGVERARRGLQQRAVHQELARVHFVVGKRTAPARNFGSTGLGLYCPPHLPAGALPPTHIQRDRAAESHISYSTIKSQCNAPQEGSMPTAGQHWSPCMAVKLAGGAPAAPTRDRTTTAAVEGGTREPS